jgi:hypothetical protein
MCMKLFRIFAIVLMSSVALAGCASTSTLRGAASGAIIGAAAGAAIGAISSSEMTDGIYFPPVLPYYIGYGTGYAVRYPTCQFIMPTPIYYQNGHVVWIDPPTDPRCSHIFLFYEQIHRQSLPRRPRR